MHTDMHLPINSHGLSSLEGDFLEGQFVFARFLNGKPPLLITLFIYEFIQIAILFKPPVFFGYILKKYPMFFAYKRYNPYLPRWKAPLNPLQHGSVT